MAVLKPTEVSDRGKFNLAFPYQSLGQATADLLNVKRPFPQRHATLSAEKRSRIPRMKRFTHFYEPRCRRLLSAARSFAGPVASRTSPGSGQRVGRTCGPGHKTARSEGMTTSHRPRRAARFFFLNHIKVLCLFVFYKRPHCACCRAFPRARSAVPPQRSLAQLSTARPTPPHWDTPVCRTAGPPRAAARRGRAGADRRSSQTLLCFGPRRGWVLWQLRQCVVTACLPHLGRDHASRWGWHQKYPYSPQKQTGFSFLLLI